MATAERAAETGEQDRKMDRDMEIEHFGDDHDSQVRLLARILEATGRGDYEAASVLRQQAIIPAEALMAAKKTRGAQWIRDQHLRTETAEAKYGKDWLAR